MTPRTRTSNKDASYKVYYSKKVPQQVHFPHRRRTVRRPLGAANNGAEKRQLKFLPEKMRIKRTETVGDSDDDSDEDIEKGGVSIKPEPEIEDIEEHESGGKAAKSRGKKRHSDAAEIHDEDDDDDVVRPAPKRRRQATAPNSSRRAKIKIEAAEEDSAGPGPSEQKPDRSRTLRRQSTMTQMVEGRRPLSDTEEPAFRPVKRTPRLSWGGQGKKGKDKKQRTLTQMVPGMKPLELLSDDDMQTLSDAEAEERESQAYGEVIAARLAGEGLIQEEIDHLKVTPDEAEAFDGAQSQSNDGKDGGAQFAEHDSSVPSVVVRSVEDSEDQTDEESYQPTQFIDAPVTRTRRSPRQLSGVKQRVPQRAGAPTTAERTTRRSKFSLLSTPEKRRVRVIASSQSPADSPLSTQVSPSKASRLPLKERSSNDQGMETPSKRKQVTFNEPTKETIPPPSLRRFKSIIQDSEDEDDDLLETDENNSRNDIGQRTQALINGIDGSSHGIPVGAETQGMLDQIDQACGDDDDDDDDEEVQPIGESSEELCVSILPRDQYEPSPELGEHFQQHNNDEEESDASSPYRAAHIGIKEEQPYDDSISGLITKEVSSEGRTPPSRSSEPASAGIELPLAPEQVPSSPPIIQQSVEDTCPSTPMVITDSEDEQEDEPNPTPPRQDTHPAQQPSSTAVQHSADLDGELVQVPQSPPGQHQTQQSHSSKAEQQLHSEWFSYSQYANARPTQSSSMKVAHDKFSYHATPKPPRPVTQTQTLGHFTSQATTIDEVTPRKNRTQRTMSTNTTPRKRASSQPFSSPSKPPPLFIPSSFPSPAKARMDEWSSPVLGNTQVTYGIGGSLEDFSIPLPPPIEDDWLDGV
jgi:hypothetical protein